MQRYSDTDGRTVRLPPLTPFHWARRGPGHAVQFYEDEQFLRRVVVNYLTDGLRNSQPVVSLASAAHTRAFQEDLTALGYAIDHLQAAGRLFFLDAGDFIDEVVSDTGPDPERFRTMVGGVIERAGGRHRVVRAYGEAVDLLWKAGRPSTALQLERLWNALAGEYHFALLCGYSIDNFMRPESAALFEDVCGLHQRVVPTIGTF